MAKFSLLARAKSTVFAVHGLSYLIRTQHNAWLHLFASLIVLVLAFGFEIAPMSWAALLVAIMLVWMAESFNTAIERICDLVAPEYNEHVKQAKDLAAGAVLITAIGAVLIGIAVILHEV